MPTPPARDPATKALQLAIDAYRAGTGATAERALEEAWRLVEPQVRVTIARKIREPDRQDDAVQGTFLKLWQAVQNWNTDRELDTASAFARWCAGKAAQNVVEHRDKIAGREAGGGALDDDALRDIIEYRASEVAGGPRLDEAQSMADFARYARDRAPSPRTKQLWPAIILAVGEGHVDRNSIGEAVGLDAGSVRREVFRMVRTLDLRALDHIEVMVDWRTRDPQPSDTGELALFGFELQEIS